MTSSAVDLRAHPVGSNLRFRPDLASLDRLCQRLFAPVDIAVLVYFRLVFGAVMLWEVWRFATYGWITADFIDPTYHFTYYGLGWIKPLPGVGMDVVFLLMAVAAIGVMLGLWYRVAASILFAAYTYVFLLDEAVYNNHYYLVALLALLTAVIPTHHALSLDARRKPALHSDTAPAWTLWSLRTMIAIPYVFGGLAKLKGDWLHGQPMRLWLAQKTDVPLVGRFFTEKWAPYAFSYAGLLLDLFIVPALLWRRSRPFAVAVIVLFHVTNAQLFPIGIFPWLMITAAALFFAPSWPRLGGLWHPATLPPAQKQGRRKRGTPATALVPSGLSTRQRLTVTLLTVFFGVQILLPLRHFLLPGNVIWTEEGMRFAWHMRLRAKWGDGTTFFVTDPTSGENWTVDPAEELAPFQADELAIEPGMILQYAHHLADRWRADGHPEVEVRVEAYASLNGRASQLLVDPTVDLAAQPRTLLHQPWVMPLTESLPPAS